MGPSLAGAASRKSPFRRGLMRECEVHRPILDRFPPDVCDRATAAAAGEVAEGTLVLAAQEAADVPSMGGCGKMSYARASFVTQCDTDKI